MFYEVPNLYRDAGGGIANPYDCAGPFNADKEDYDQYALLDLIEFLANNIKDYCRVLFDKTNKYYALYFEETNNIFNVFRNDINEAFHKCNLLYTLNEKGEVERIEENSILNSGYELAFDEIKDQILKELIKFAISLHQSPRVEDHKTATEKIWDAFERLKTYYPDVGKKASTQKLINKISDNQLAFTTLFEKEFKELTDIGNQFCIRHYETDRINIDDIKYYDYFFNRCLSLIYFVMGYLD